MDGDSSAWMPACLLRARAQRLGARVVQLEEGQRFTVGGAQFEVLAPPIDQAPLKTPHNNDSLVLRITHGRHSLLLTGDIERQIEWRLLGEGRLSHIDVLKVPHHGSRTSSTPEFLNAVRPAFALISAGFANSFGNPHRDVLERLTERHAAVFRTDLWGRVSVRTDGRRFEVETSRWESEGPGFESPF